LEYQGNDYNFTAFFFENIKAMYFRCISAQDDIRRSNHDTVPYHNTAALG
jgi:hypothetical protein